MVSICMHVTGKDANAKQYDSSDGKRNPQLHVDAVRSTGPLDPATEVPVQPDQ
jgi:hypothetical protein